MKYIPFIITNGVRHGNNVVTYLLGMSACNEHYYLKKNTETTHNKVKSNDNLAGGLVHFRAIDVDVDVDVSSGFCLGIGTPGYLTLRKLVTGQGLKEGSCNHLSSFFISQCQCQENKIFRRRSHPCFMGVKTVSLRRADGS